jgi:hypothetical protein
MLSKTQWVVLVIFKGWLAQAELHRLDLTFDSADEYDGVMECGRRPLPHVG